MRCSLLNVNLQVLAPTDSTKIVLSGDGLDKAFVNKSAQFCVDAAEAGVGKAYLLTRTFGDISLCLTCIFKSLGGDWGDLMLRLLICNLF